jgi:curved DNA-binding protein CbpA
MKTHYDVLGVAPSADAKTLKKAYRALVKEFHPDVAKRKGKSGAKVFEEITAAWTVLSDADKRRDYDASLAARKPAAPRRTFPFREFKTWLFSLSFVRAFFIGKKVAAPKPVVSEAASQLSVDELLKRAVYSPNPFVQLHSVRAILAKNRKYVQPDLLRLLASGISEDARIAIIEGLSGSRSAKFRQVLSDLVDVERSLKVKQAMRKALAA